MSSPNSSPIVPSKQGVIQPVSTNQATASVERKIRKTTISAALYDEARALIPGGASSIIRWSSYEPYPIYMDKGRGARITDVDGNEYLDYLLGYGTLINGHAHPKILQALSEQLEKVTMFGTPVELEVKLARKFKQMVPSSDMVIFGTNGTDATMNAIRIARAATGKDTVLKFE